MDGHCLRQTNLSTALERAIDGNKGDSRILHAAEELFEATLDAESAWQFFRYMLTFRGSSNDMPPRPTKSSPMPLS